ncbi:MAG: SulP family inorganic anion transporter [Burkholderiaceae bacterium]
MRPRDLLDRIGFHPRLIDHLRGYGRDDLRADTVAGVTVGFVALPLAMAFAIASGVKPEQGLITAIVGGLLISLLGGSRVQIGGPAGAFVVLLYGIVERYGLANLLISVILAGVLLFTMGLLKFGNLVRFVPVSVVIGFTNGIAVVIGFSQIRDFLGLQVDKMPANFLSQVAVLWNELGTINPAALGIGGASLLMMLCWPKGSARPGAGRWASWWSRIGRVPPTIVVLSVGVLAVTVLNLPVETIGTRFGGIPQQLPAPRLPTFDWDGVQQLVAPTISIALLGAIESLLCARVADSLIDDRHDPNQELMAQGLANFITPFFGGIAATGTIARTVTNVRAGARTPVAGVIHALTLLLTMLLLAPLARHIPLASLAAILLVVAWNMGEWRAFAHLRHYTVSYRTILLSAFGLTVVFDLTVAVQIGLGLACLFFIHRMSTLTRLEPIALPPERARTADGRGVHAWRIFGSLFFGAVTKLEPLFDPRAERPDVLILEMHQLVNLDTSGLDVLESLRRMLDKRGARLILCDVNEQPLSLLRRSGFIDRLGDGGVEPDLDAALARAASAPGSESASALRG